MQQQKLTEKLIRFRNDRNWQHFHSLKNLVASVSIEAAELLELTQWKSAKELEIIDAELKDKFEDEIADVFIYLLLVCEKLDVDITQASIKKIKKNAEKYPVKAEWDEMWSLPFDRPELVWSKE